MSKLSASTATQLGFALLIVSVIANATGFHTNAAALAHASPLVVAMLACSMAVGWLMAAGAVWRMMGWRAAQMHTVHPRAVGEFIRQCSPWVFGPPLCVAIAAWLLNHAVEVYGPAICAFLMNLTLVLLVLGGMATGERLRGREVLAIVVTIGGAFLFSYQGGRLHWAAIGLMTLVCLATAGKQLLVKRLADNQPLPVVMTTMLLLSSLWLVAMALASGGWARPAWPAVGLTALTALIGNLVGMCSLYSAYRLVGVSRGAPLDAMRPLAVLLIALMLGAALPEPIQLAGAAMILTGSATLAWLGTRRHPTTAADAARQRIAATPPQQPLMPVRAASSEPDQ